MKKGTLVAGLDLGTTKTCAVIAEVTGDARAPGVRVLGVGLAKGSGVRRGVVGSPYFITTMLRYVHIVGVMQLAGLLCAGVTRCAGR